MKENINLLLFVVNYLIKLVYHQTANAERNFHHYEKSYDKRFLAQNYLNFDKI